jgi:hypothetical protein
MQIELPNSQLQIKRGEIWSQGKSFSKATMETKKIKIYNGKCKSTWSWYTQKMFNIKKTAYMCRQILMLEHRNNQTPLLWK